mmetsp:Transcript_35294/g.89912  ORF Transcript_35294/g.89912 Transcript_35294/m.89912 type:complete len:266 (+) Transcript_35294:427-1224(+)
MPAETPVGSNCGAATNMGPCGGPRWALVPPPDVAHRGAPEGAPDTGGPSSVAQRLTLAPRAARAAGDRDFEAAARLLSRLGLWRPIILLRLRLLRRCDATLERLLERLLFFALRGRDRDLDFEHVRDFERDFASTATATGLGLRPVPLAGGSKRGGDAGLGGSEDNAFFDLAITGAAGCGGGGGASAAALAATAALEKFARALATALAAACFAWRPPATVDSCGATALVALATAVATKLCVVLMVGAPSSPVVATTEEALGCTSS